MFLLHRLQQQAIEPGGMACGRGCGCGYEIWSESGIGFGYGAVAVRGRVLVWFAREQGRRGERSHRFVGQGRMAWLPFLLAGARRNRVHSVVFVYGAVHACR